MRFPLTKLCPPLLLLALAGCVTSPSGTEGRSAPERQPEEPAERILRDIAWLADPAREGRGLATESLRAAGEYLEQRFTRLGLVPAGEGGSYRHAFQVTTAVEEGPETRLVLGAREVEAEARAVLGFSAEGEVRAPLVLAGHGIREPSLGVDDYAGLEVKGRVVLVRRFVPGSAAFQADAAQRRHGDLRYKAWVAKQQGAAALLVVDWPEPPQPTPEGWRPPSEAALPRVGPEGFGDAGLPVVVVKRAAVEALWPRLLAGEPVEAAVKVRLAVRRGEAFNVVGRLRAGAPESERLPGVVVVGAHYDHLGLGGRSSLAPDKHEPHLGADDNASGTAALLEIARELGARRERLRRDVVLVAFSGEEAGLLGSTHFTRAPPGGVKVEEMVAMLNLDMVGRLRDDTLHVLGGLSASEWSQLVPSACEQARLQCTLSGDGYGPSDHMAFYAVGVPVLHFFTGAHEDYHKPSDTVEHVNAAGVARVARVVGSLTEVVSGQPSRLSYQRVPAPLPRGDRRSFGASLGTIPDYAGPPRGVQGVLLAGVREGGAAEAAGLRRGDVLVRLGRFSVGGLEDFMYALNGYRPGETVTAVVLREGRELSLEVTFQEGRR